MKDTQKKVEAAHGAPRSRYSELKHMLDERRREIQAEVQGKMRGVREEGAWGGKLNEVLDAVEIKMLVEGTNLPPIKPLPTKNDDGVQQVIKPEPGRTPVKGGERPATA